MRLSSISQCSRLLDFGPLAPWPEVLPALAWRGHLLTGFERPASGVALDLSEAPFIPALKAAYPELGFAAFARLLALLERHLPDTFLEFREPLCQAYGWRWNDRFAMTLEALRSTPAPFQKWADEKGLAARDVAPLLALPGVSDFEAFLTALVQLPVSKSEGVRALELGVELFLLGRPLNDLLPSTDVPALYLRRLEQWRRPNTAASDESWRDSVAQWPWPAQVQGHWQRFGDQAGLEIRLRANSPSDLQKKLERLGTIQETWSCKT